MLLLVSVFTLALAQNSPVGYTDTPMLPNLPYRVQHEVLAKRGEARRRKRPPHSGFEPHPSWGSPGALGGPPPH